MKRREFIALLGGAALAWPLAAHAQQPAMPVIGFLSVTFAGEQPHWLTAFRRGLSESGFVEGQNASIEYRWAEAQYHRLPELVDDLIRRRVSVIVTSASTPAALAAKAGSLAVLPPIRRLCRALSRTSRTINSCKRWLASAAAAAQVRA